MAYGWENVESVFSGFTNFCLNHNPPLDPRLVMSENLWWYRFQTVILLTTGTMLLMWLGEQISERGIGNGVSLVITIGIIARLPAAAQGLRDMFFPARGVESQFNFFHAIALVLLLFAVVAGVIAVTQAQRKIPVQYAQRAVGRKVFQGGTSFMPLRVNYSGVMPVIFAQAILMFPQRILQTLGTSFKIPFLIDVARTLGEGEFVYLTVYGLMILFFSYFWVATQFNEIQIADDLKKYGGYIPGVRPGTATSDFLHNAMHRITLAGAIFLTVIAVIPIMLSRERACELLGRLLFWGDEHAHPGGRGVGHHAPDGVPPADAPLRRVPQEGPAARAVLAPDRGRPCQPAGGGQTR